jgi:hypothetical protein
MRSAAAAGVLRTAAVLLCVLAAPAAVAKELVVKAAPCATNIEVRADGVPLDEVLRAVTKALGVRLEAKATLTEETHFSAIGTPERVLTLLMQGRNVVLDSHPVAKCEGREVLTTVWILPAGEAAPARAQASTAAPAAVQVPGEAQFGSSRPPRPRGVRKRLGEQEWQRVKEEWRAGKVQADPETGLPVPVDPTQREEAKGE